MQCNWFQTTEFHIHEWNGTNITSAILTTNVFSFSLCSFSFSYNNTHIHLHTLKRKIHMQGKSKDHSRVKLVLSKSSSKASVERNSLLRTIYKDIVLDLFFRHQMFGWKFNGTIKILIALMKLPLVSPIKTWKIPHQIFSSSFFIHFLYWFLWNCINDILE